LESALNPPRPDGRWPLVMTDQLAVSFDRDNTGRVVGLKLHEGGLEFDVPREGVVLTPEIPVSELQKYVGRYGDAAGANAFSILIRNQRLAIRLPNNTSFDLRPPDAAGRRATRANLGSAVTFEESPTGGEVGGMRVPHSYIEANEMTGRAIYHVERVEVGVELAADTFTLQSSTASDRGR